MSSSTVKFEKYQSREVVEAVRVTAENIDAVTAAIAAEPGMEVVYFQTSVSWTWRNQPALGRSGQAAVGDWVVVSRDWHGRLFSGHTDAAFRARYEPAQQQGTAP
jgi:hypothetical protein